MPRPLSNSKKKTVELDAALMTLYLRRKEEAEKAGEKDFPQTLTDFLNRAGWAWLQAGRPPLPVAEARALAAKLRQEADELIDLLDQPPAQPKRPARTPRKK